MRNMTLIVMCLLQSVTFMGCNSTAGQADGERSEKCKEQRVLCVPEEYDSINDAVQAAVQGDVISIGQGTYSENVIVDKNLTLEGEGKGATHIVGANHEQPILTVKLYMSIRGVDIGAAKTCIYLDANSSAVVTDCMIRDCLEDGILFSSDEGAYLWIADSEIMNAGDGIDVKSDGAGVILNNTFSNHSDDAIDFDGDVNFVVYGNTIINSGDDGVEIRVATNTAIQLVNNVSEANGEDGIEVIDTPVEDCIENHDVCSNRLYILGNALRANGRYGLGFVDEQKEQEGTNPLHLDKLVCENNLYSGNNDGASTDNYREECE